MTILVRITPDFLWHCLLRDGDTTFACGLSVPDVRQDYGQRPAEMCRTCQQLAREQRNAKRVTSMPVASNKAVSTMVGLGYRAPTSNAIPPNHMTKCPLCGCSINGSKLQKHVKTVCPKRGKVAEREVSTVQQPKPAPQQKARAVQQPMPVAHSKPPPSDTEVQREQRFNCIELLKTDTVILRETVIRRLEGITYVFRKGSPVWFDTITQVQKPKVRIPLVPVNQVVILVRPEKCIADQKLRIKVKVDMLSVMHKRPPTGKERRSSEVYICRNYRVGSFGV